VTQTIAGASQSKEDPPVQPGANHWRCASPGLALLFAAAASLAAPTAPFASTEREWVFAVLLNGKPIGEHRFTVVPMPEGRRVTSDASFAVKIIGITAYRYRHHAEEQWRGDCLAALEASTDDDGKASRVRAQAGADGLVVITASGKQPLPVCTMSFAYWNPAIRTQTQLLNAQTGLLQPVQVTRMDTGAVEVRGRETMATRWRISGPASPVDVWYTDDGDWVGLDSTVAGGRQLSYWLK
jgi:hypothetical protein